ncbi:MAG: PD-(D/E)XK nuclease family protein [Isosphaerales bacterium]
MSRRSQKPSSGAITDNDVEERIREFFRRNYDLLRQEGGHVLAEGAKQQALEQALLYWRKLRAIANSVTDTEVKLALPGQVTPKGRQFVIEGVVDIVRDGNEVRMYDLKTHEEREVRAERDLYEDQLNVYAYIWKKLRGQSLNGTAIIATRLPLELREALRSGDPTIIREAMDAWQPVVDLPFDEKDVEHTVADFGRCVDDIEEGKFAPPPPEELSQPRGTRRRKDHGGLPSTRAESEPTFAQIHCRNCDARFSCSSYRAYEKGEARRSRAARRGAGRGEEVDRELDAWIEENLADS